MSANSRKIPASLRKLKKAREDGDVAKSRDLSGAMILAAGLIVLILLKNSFFKLKQLSRILWASSGDFTTNDVLVYVGEALELSLVIILPFTAVLLIVAVLIEGFQVGFEFSSKLLQLKFSRLNIFSGLKRMFGLTFSEHDSPEIIRSLIGITKMLFICFISAAIFFGITQKLLWSGGAIFYQTPQETLTTIKYYGIVATSIYLGMFFILGIFELIYQRKLRAKRLAMDIEEFKREARENEGDPEVKGMRKSLYHDLMLNSIIQRVRRAKVIIVGRSI